MFVFALGFGVGLRVGFGFGLGFRFTLGVYSDVGLLLDVVQGLETKIIGILARSSIQCLLAPVMRHPRVRWLRLGGLPVVRDEEFRVEGVVGGVLLSLIWDQCAVLAQIFNRLRLS